MKDTKKDEQSRKWLLTINNPTEKKLEHGVLKNKLSQLRTKYWCMADEIGLEEKTPHTHVYIELNSPARFSTIKKLFPEAHIDKVRGSSHENKAYVEKSGKWENDEKADTKIVGSFEESGELPEQEANCKTGAGRIYKFISDGMSNAEIMKVDPDLAAHIQKMDKIRMDVLEEQYREVFRQIEVTYIFGETGTGKTRSVMETHGYSNVCRVTDYSHPFDGYKQESVIVFEEFRSSLPLGDMLNYLDGYPVELPARYANKVACFETVYIISNIDLKDQYPMVQKNEPASWKAFLRRIGKVVEFLPDGEKLEHGSGTEFVFNKIIDGFSEVPQQEEIPF